MTKTNIMKLLLLSLIIIVFTSCSSETADEASSSYSTHEEVKMSLEEKERQNPTEFLSVEGTYKKNLLDEWVVEGTIQNTASIATYKDVVLKIVYYTKTQTELGSEEKSVIEYFRPNTSQPFKIKTKGYEGTESIGLEIISASNVE